MGRDGRSERARRRHQLSAESDIDNNTLTIIYQLYIIPMSHIIYPSLTGVVLESAASVWARTLHNLSRNFHVRSLFYYLCMHFVSDETRITVAVM